MENEESRFITGLTEASSEKLTENGAFAFNTTSDPLIDLFGMIGGLRTRTEDDIQSLFSNSFEKYPLLTLKLAFYARNIRGGLGERSTFRAILKWLADRKPDIMKANFSNIAKFGRYDDFYSFVGTKIEDDAFKYMYNIFIHDFDAASNDPNFKVSLIGKWLKSANSHNPATRALGLKTVEHFGLTEKCYRQRLSLLRKRIDVVECKMSSNSWKDIKYSAVPSKAISNYSSAFCKHDPDGYGNFLSNVASGKETIKASTLYPYDICKKYNLGGLAYDETLDDTVELQWKSQPNYIEGNNNILVIADTSGSMMGTPLDISVSLAIYFAERNNGAFKNCWMNFSDNPTFQVLKGETLLDKIRSIDFNNWDGSTNIEAAFDLILNTAIKGNLKKSELPKALIIISDMEFNVASESEDTSYLNILSKKFNDAGYTLPKLVFWNANARENTFHAKSSDKNIQFISGASASSFKLLIDGLTLSPIELIEKALNDPIYDSVVI